MDAIEARCQKRLPMASGREKHSIKLCLDFIAHTRRLVKKSGLTSIAKVDQALKKLKQPPAKKSK